MPEEKRVEQAGRHLDPQAVVSQARPMLSERERSILAALGMRPGQEIARTALALAEIGMSYWEIVYVMTGSEEIATAMFGPRL